MNIEEAYQWLHGDRVEYSGCRTAAETYNAALTAERAVLERERLVSDKLEKALSSVQSEFYQYTEGFTILWDEIDAALAEVAAIRAKE